MGNYYAIFNLIQKAKKEELVEQIENIEQVNPTLKKSQSENVLPATPPNTPTNKPINNFVEQIDKTIQWIDGDIKKIEKTEDLTINIVKLVDEIITNACVLVENKKTQDSIKKVSSNIELVQQNIESIENVTKQIENIIQPIEELDNIIINKINF